jgi:hypothetical protein
MDYYYSLLESYELLKRRKFKLSLREDEEQGESVPDADSLIKAMVGQAPGSTKKFAHPHDPKKSATAEVTDNSFIKVNFGKGFGRILADAKSGKLVGARTEAGRDNMKELEQWFGGGAPQAGQQGAGEEEEEGGEAQPGGEELVPQESPAEKAADSLGDTLSKVRSNVAEDEPESDDPEIEDEEYVALTQAQEDKWLEETERLKEAARKTGQLTKMDEETIVQTFNGVNDFLRLGDEIANNPGMAGKMGFSGKINDLIEKYKITKDKDGCLYFDEISIALCRGDTPTYKALAEFRPQLEEVQRKDREQNGKASVAKDIPSKRAAKGSSDAIRGVAIEDADNLSPMLERCLGITDRKEMVKCAETIKTAVITSLKKHEAWENCKKERARGSKIACGKEVGASFEKLLTALSVGLLAEDSLIFTGPEEDFDRNATNFIIDRLVEQSEGRLSREDAKAFVEKVVEENNGPKALLLVVMANRKFSQQIHADIIPTRTNGVGQGQESGGEEGKKRASNVIGAKKDVEDVYCPGKGEFEKDSPEELRKKLVTNIRENILSPEQLDHYAKPNRCNGGLNEKGNLTRPKKGEKPQTKEEKREANIDAAIGSMIKDGVGDDEGCLVIGREPKTHDSSKKPSALGQMSQQKQREMFSYLGGKGSDGLQDAETERLDAVSSLLEKCVGAGTVKEAVGFMDDIAPRLDRVDAILTPGSWVEGEDGEAMEGASEGYIDQWLANKKKPDKDDKTRAEEAKKCLRNEGEGTKKGKKSCEHLDKLKSEVKNLIMNRELDKYTDKKGYVSGRGKAFLQLMYISVAGSDQEVLNEKRGLSDNIQKAGLRNAEIEANLGNPEMKFRRNKITVEGEETDDEGEKVQVQPQRTQLPKSDPEGKDFSEAPEELAEETAWGGTATLIDPRMHEDNQNRASLSPERGEYKVRTGGAKDLYRQLGDEDTAEETARQHAKGMVKRDGKWVKREKGEPIEDMFVQFLQGQQSLLEKLLSQTT